jgi:hypothetical protein
VDKYCFNIQPSQEEIEDYQKNDANILCVKVLNAPGIDYINGRVQLFLSRDAMLGLGKSLIRQAQQKDRMAEHEHLDPIKDGDLCEKFGVYLHPDSAEVIITWDEMGTVENTQQSINKD